MPASTSDPISSMLQRTFGGLDHKREGLIRGGNSSSAITRPFSPSVDKKLQASAKHGLVTSNMEGSSISFDAPTSFKSDTTALHPKVIVLNPKAAQQTNVTAKKEQKDEKSKGEGIPEAKVTLYRPTEIRVGYSQMRVAGAGMANAGNTCYLNSTLQALFHIPALFNYFQNNCPSQHVSKCSSSLSANGFLQSCTICAMLHTLRESLRISVIRPNRIYEKLKIICKHMVQGRQEDAHEFLRYLIDSLQRSYLNTIPGSKSLDSVSKETTPFNQIFGGYIRQEVTCLRCKHVSTTFQHFMDILVEIQQVNTIEEALAHFFKQKRLGQPNDPASLYKCEKCKVKVQAKWQCFMERPPAVLCVQLKRFSLMGGKIGKPIQLCRSLSVNPFLKNGNGQNVQYLLRSMITHVGPSPNCGHYTAIGEAANGQFFQFDDSSVRPISMQQVLRTASYVVFYEMTPASWAVQLNNKMGKMPASAASSSIGPAQYPPPTRPTQPQAATAPAATASRPTYSPQPMRAGPSVSQPMASNTSSATASPRPSPQIQPKIINKIGVVSSVAKSIVSNAISDIAKTVNKPKPTMGGLVPYDDDNDNDSDSETDVIGKSKQPPQKPVQSTQPSFVPRAVTMKNLVEKPLGKVLDSKPVKVISATAKNWTVTDVDHHNPSVHSDNSTGSTSSSWIITPQRPSSSMSVEAADTSTSTSASASKWTVTNLKKAIDEDATAKSASVSSGTSTPSSTGGSSGSFSSSSHKPEMSSRKRPSVDDSNGSDYDNELDRGRTKKVKKSLPHMAASQNFFRQNSNGDNNQSNPFQKQQDWQNRTKLNGNGHQNGHQNGYQNGSNRNGSQHWQHHRDHSQHYRSNDRSNGSGGHYNRNNDRGNGSGDRHYHNNGGRRKSFGGSFRDNKDNNRYYNKYRDGGHQRSSSNHHESNHYRDNFHRRNSSR